MSCGQYLSMLGCWQPSRHHIVTLRDRNEASSHSQHCFVLVSERFLLQKLRGNYTVNQIISVVKGRLMFLESVKNVVYYLLVIHILC